MKIMATSFRRSHAGTAALCPQPCSRPMLTHACTRDSWTLTASLRQSLVGSLLLSPGSWCTQGSICALQESVSPVLGKFWWLYGGLMATSSKSAYARVGRKIHLGLFVTCYANTQMNFLVNQIDHFYILPRKKYIIERLR